MRAKANTVLDPTQFFGLEARYRWASDLIEQVSLGDAQYRMRLIDAFAEVNREKFVESGLSPRARENLALPIGHGQTISKPATVVRMLASLKIQAGERVLEVGCGCGYVLALLTALGALAFGVERDSRLAQQTRTRLDAIGLTQVLVRSGDGLLGWQDTGPFDAIIISAAVTKVPNTLLRQLAPRGRLIAPVVSTLVSDRENISAPVQNLELHSAVSLVPGFEARFISVNLGPCSFVDARESTPKAVNCQP